MARRRNRGLAFNRSMVVGARRGGIRNWIIGTQSFDTAGAVMGTPFNTWGGNGAGNSIAAGGSVSMALAMIQPVAGTSTPALGAMRIDEVRGRLHFSGDSSAVGLVAVCGIYVAQLNNTSSRWAVRSVHDPLEAQRDDYFWLTNISCLFGLVTANFAGQLAHLDIQLNTSIVIGAGEALVLTVSNAGGGSLNMTPHVRTLVGPVA